MRCCTRMGVASRSCRPSSLQRKRRVWPSPIRCRLSDPALAFTVAHAAQQAQDSRTLYVVGRSGQVKADIRWDQYGVGAKVFEWGIAVHQGHQYGWLNRIVMLLGCIAVWILAISGALMWWKRRPRQSWLGAPPASPDARARATVLGIVLPLAVLYPLTGRSLLFALAIDRLLFAVTRAR